MKLYSENKEYKLYQGNMLDMLEVIEPDSIDSIVCDPPYELNFMGKGWDNSGIAFNKESWIKCYEVLKPGGYLLAFGGSRTFHRIACAIEDAGFEIRDTIMWLYGSGFPKSMDIEKAINKRDGVEFESKPASGVGFMNSNDDGYHNTLHQLTQVGDSSDRAKQYHGWGTCLKPSFEPIIVARKPFKGSLVDNVLEYGVGGLNIDECRVPFNGDKWNAQKSGKTSRAFQSEATTTANGVCEANDAGRFPANTILTYDETDKEEVCSGFPYSKSNGGETTMPDLRDVSKKSKEAIGIDKLSFGQVSNADRKQSTYIAPCDSGSAARYFYCAKASKKDRDEGLDGFEEKQCCTISSEDKSGKVLDDVTKRFASVKKNTHPTVKPTELMQYLVRLVTPNGGTVLDPFNGSGSTGKAVMYENKERNKQYKYIGIELTDEYLPISRARIEYVSGPGEKVLQEEVVETKKQDNEDLDSLLSEL